MSKPQASICSRSVKTKKEFKDVIPGQSWSYLWVFGLLIQTAYFCPGTTCTYGHRRFWIKTTETAHITLHKIPLLHLSSWDNIFRLTMRPGLFLRDVPPHSETFPAWRLHGEIWNLAWDEAPEPMMPRRPATREPSVEDRSFQQFMFPLIDLCIYGTWRWWPTQ